MQPSQLAQIPDHLLDSIRDGDAGPELVPIAGVDDVVAGVVSEDEDELPDDVAFLDVFL